jgi:hypothetical protein
MSPDRAGGRSEPIAACDPRTSSVPRHRAVVGLAAFVAIGLVVSACGSNRPPRPSGSESVSVLPSRSVASTSRTPLRTTTGAPAPSETTTPTAPVTPTRTGTATESATTPTATPTATATVTQTATTTETATATQTATATTATATPTATATETPTPEPSPTANPTPAAANSSTSSTSTPLWWWLIIAAALLAAAAAGWWLVRRRSRKRAWQDRFAASKGEVAQVARELIPQLSQAPSAQQIAGGWAVSADRVVAIEDRLTSLEATAVDDVGRTHAQTLRDSVRTSRSRLDALADIQDVAVARSELQAAAMQLEAALAAIDRPPPQPDGINYPP